MDDKRAGGKVTIIRRGVRDETSGATTPVVRIHGIEKADLIEPPARAVMSNTFDPEDEYRHLYAGALNNDVALIEPPYNLRVLDRLSQENNTLSPCIEAMVTNIDGTGFDIVKDDTGAGDPNSTQDKAAIDDLWGFFAEPWPGESFVTIRKKLRRDHERTGNSYLEWIRNASDEVVFCRHTDAKMMRLVKLSEPMPERVTVKRNGRDVSITVMKRYRRFAQLVNGKEVRYFKEFGCPLDLDKYTGRFAKPGQRLGFQRRASEIMHFTALPDANTPYGVPRWINQIPSVLGSRKAEEYNVEFFDAGGVPPAILAIQGGTMSDTTRQALDQKLLGAAFRKNRVLVLELEPSAGSLDSPGNVKLTVERFGAERQNDSMFENYDERCEIRVRRSFRLPPIFVGAAADYSFATAFASYTMAEAQVFRPERDEFDEAISVKVMPALGKAGYRIKSTPVNVEDATLKLQGIELGMETQQVDAENVLDEINKVVGTKLKVSKTLPTPQEAAIEQTRAKAQESAKIARTQQGKLQSNSTKPQPKPVPVRSPAVRKDGGRPFGLAVDLVKAARDADLALLSDCLDEVRGLGEEELADLRMEIEDFVRSTMRQAAE